MNKTTLMEEADTFIVSLYKELEKTEQETRARRNEIKKSIELYGYYEHTLEELTYGARIAWRNSNRCIGRLFWNNLEVVDARDAKTSDEVFDYLYQHLRVATNHGKIKPLITIFAPEIPGQKRIKVWNHQLLRYAGYQTAEGIVGDSDSIAFTAFCMELGWRGEGTAFDILPLVVQIDDNEPEYRDIPQNLVYEVRIEHAKHDIFGGEEVKWYAVPIISDMRLEIGGLDYIAAPFNGWYMGTEIGARNLADESRYNLLPTIAKHMELDTNHNRTLWKDEALIALNQAVLDSYKRHGVTLVDHHTASHQFQLFEEKEEKAGRDVTGKWSWLIPPVSPATTHMFFKPYDNSIHTPNYFYQKRDYPAQEETDV